MLIAKSAIISWQLSLIVVSRLLRLLLASVFVLIFVNLLHVGSFLDSLGVLEAFGALAVALQLVVRACANRASMVRGEGLTLDTGCCTSAHFQAL